MKFEMPVITVSDIERSSDFYQKVLGLEVEFDFGANIAFKDSISLWDRERASEIVFGEKGKFLEYENPKPVELYFETEDLEGFEKVLEELDVDPIHPLKEEPWGQRNLRFLDPDGYVIEVGEPMKNVVLRLKEQGMSLEEISKKSQMARNVIQRMVEGEQ